MISPYARKIYGNPGEQRLFFLIWISLVSTKIWMLKPGFPCIFLLSMFLCNNDLSLLFAEEILSGLRELLTWGARKERNFVEKFRVTGMEIVMTRKGGRARSFWSFLHFWHFVRCPVGCPVWQPANWVQNAISAKKTENCHHYVDCSLLHAFCISSWQSLGK